MPILVAPLAVALVMLCVLTFRDSRRVRFIVWASLVLLGVFVRAACGRPASRRRRTHGIPVGHLGVPSNRHAQARRRAGRVDASRDWQWPSQSRAVADDLRAPQYRRTLPPLRGGRVGRRASVLSGLDETLAQRCLLELAGCSPRNRLDEFDAVG